MAALHLVDLNAGGEDALARCLARAGAGDAVLLWGNAGPETEAIVRENGGRHGIAWLAARPDSALVPPEVARIDYAGFVALTERCHPIVSWF